MESAGTKKRGQGSEDEGSGARTSAPTPIWVSKRTRTVLVLAGFLLAALIVWLVPDAAIMTLGGIALALILSHPVRWLQRLMPRGLAILSSFLILVGLLALAVASVVPILAEQLGALISAAPDFANQARVSLQDLAQPLEERGILPGDPNEYLGNFSQDLSNVLQQVAQQILGGTISILSGTIGAVVTLFGVVFISAYLLVDTRRVKAAFLSASPRSYRRDVRDLWSEFDYSLSRYLGGLLLSISIQGALSAVALFLLDVPYALLLGTWVALTAIIPYIGAWLGAVPAVLLALSVSPTTALLTALLFFVIQQLEGNFLTPKIQGEALKAHPIIVFLAVIVAGGIFGILGAIFAVPALAVFRVLFDFFRARMRTSE